MTEAYFATKVINGGGKNGSYFYYLRYEDAARKTGANECTVCGVASRGAGESWQG